MALWSARLSCYVIRITQDCHAGWCQLLEARVSFGLLYSGKQCSFITLHGIHSATADASDEGFKHLRETLDDLRVTCKTRTSYISTSFRIQFWHEWKTKYLKTTRCWRVPYRFLIISSDFPWRGVELRRIILLAIRRNIRIFYYAPRVEERGSRTTIVCKFDYGERFSHPLSESIYLFVLPVFDMPWTQN